MVPTLVHAHLSPIKSSLQIQCRQQETKNEIFTLRWIKNDLDDTIKIN